VFVEHNCVNISNAITRWSGAGGIQALSERATVFLQCFTLLVWSWYDL